MFIFTALCIETKIIKIVKIQKNYISAFSLKIFLKITVDVRGLMKTNKVIGSGLIKVPSHHLLSTRVFLQNNRNETFIFTFLFDFT